MSKLKSGVYLVRYQDINKFFKDAESNGWKHSFEQPQEEIYDTLMFLDREEKTIFLFFHIREKTIRGCHPVPSLFLN